MCLFNSVICSYIWYTGPETTIYFCFTRKQIKVRHLWETKGFCYAEIYTADWRNAFKAKAVITRIDLLNRIITITRTDSRRHNLNQKLFIFLIEKKITCRGTTIYLSFGHISSTTLYSWSSVMSQSRILYKISWLIKGFLEYVWYRFVFEKQA